MNDPAQTFGIPGNQQGKERPGVLDVEDFNGL
jgi:hypothetical protein